MPPIIAKTAFNNANIKTDEYKSKEFKVQKALRDKLTAIGLGDIALDFRNIVTKPNLLQRNKLQQEKLMKVFIVIKQ